MWGYALRRCGLSVVIVALVMLALFTLLRLMPGDPAAIAPVRAPRRRSGREMRGSNYSTSRC